LYFHNSTLGKLWDFSQFWEKDGILFSFSGKILGKILGIFCLENKSKTVILGKYWEMLTPLNFSQIYFYLGYNLPKMGKYWEKYWEYFVLKTNPKLLFWENIGTC